MNANLTTTVRKPFSSNRATDRAQAFADSDGVVRVYDDVAGYYTTCHSLTATQEARVRRLATRPE